MKNLSGKFIYVVFLLWIAMPLYADRDVTDFNQGWRFLKGEESQAALNTEFDDTQWEAVSLPHDWGISGPFNEKENGYAAKLPWRDTGIYRNSFTLNEADEGKQVYFDFNGVMAFPSVYINGQLAGEWDYGYMSFRVDATPFVKFGEKNVIAVQADTRQHGTRWYPGGGLYRKVSMTICEPIHVAHWGMFITTPEVLEKSAIVKIESNVENHQTEISNVDVVFQLFDPQGRLLDTRELKGEIAAGENRTFATYITVTKPLRWDITYPQRYQARTIVRKNDRVVDTVTDHFGIRTFQFTANDGFYLNGRRVQLYGVNLHHDQGPLGAAFYPRAMERQLEIMQDMGCNAIRTSHNPPSPELLELCDRMGLLVWNEAFDKWDTTADRIDGQPPLRQHAEKQIRNLVMRDRNHPSVITWSIGNEITNQPWNKEGKSAERVAFMTDFVRQYDPTRPVTLGCFIPNTVYEPILDALDMTGWNYDRRYADYREKYPHKPILYSESASALSTRGFYTLPLPTSKTQYAVKEHQVSSYDHSAAKWSDIADVEFQLMEEDAFVAGEFVWTGFDYLGEPTPFSQEARSSYFGIVDLCGIPKDRFYLYRSYWNPDETTIHILPHWNWPEQAGKNVPVYVYTNGDEAELFLNGKSLGKRSKVRDPKTPVSLAQDKPVTTGVGHEPGQASWTGGNDGSRRTGWSTNSREPGTWWQVDMGEPCHIGFIDILFEQEARSYQYRILASVNADNWQPIATKADWDGNTQRMTYEVETTARYLRLEFTQLQRRNQPSFREFCVYPEPIENPYFAIMDTYRLRWLNVKYEPGELKVVAYNHGKKIGETFMHTADEPTALRLTPDRTTLAATGEDLAYILVEAIDQNGTLCPLADTLVHFVIDGPASIAGVGNGNPLSYEPFQANYRKLFYGKAMLIVKTDDAAKGEIIIQARAEGLKAAQLLIHSQ